MEEFGRHTASRGDRAEEIEIEKSLRVSNYLDDILESIHSGVAPKVNVPNYQRGSAFSPPSESQGVNMDFDSFLNQVPDDQVKTAMNDTLPPREGEAKTFSSATSSANSSTDSRPRYTISRNQAMAIKKYPTLIEFLGRPEGDKIAKHISGSMNILMADIIGANSKEANECAIECKADKQNLKQYFQGKDWVCRVTASGLFHGDEAIYYNKDKDLACVLRKSQRGEQIKYADVSVDFNIIYEVGEGEIPPTTHGKVEASAEEATSVAEQGDNNVPEEEVVVGTDVAEDST